MATALAQGLDLLDLLDIEVQEWIENVEKDRFDELIVSMELKNVKLVLLGSFTATCFQLLQNLNNGHGNILPRLRLVCTTCGDILIDGMKLHLHELRNLIRTALCELTDLKHQEQDTWQITPGVKDPGLTVKVAQKPYSTSLFKSKLTVTSFIQINNQFEKDLIEDGFAPADAEPSNMVHAIKAQKPVTNSRGVTFLPDQRVFQSIIDAAVQRAKIILVNKPVDIITTLESKSRMADVFAERLASTIGAEFIPRGLVKGQARLNVDDPSHKLSAQSKKTLTTSFANSHEDGIFKMKKFPAKFRHLVDMDIQHNDQLADKLTSPDEQKPNIVLVDDIITSGSTLDNGINAVAEFANVIAIMTVFKMKQA